MIAQLQNSLPQRISQKLRLSHGLRSLQGLAQPRTGQVVLRAAGLGSMGPSLSSCRGLHSPQSQPDTAHTVVRRGLGAGSEVSPVYLVEKMPRGHSLFERL